MSDDRQPEPWESPYDRANRLGRESSERGGDWRDNPYSPGTREWFEFEDGLKDQR